MDVTRERVRARYARAAVAAGAPADVDDAAGSDTAAASAGCCGPAGGDCGDAFGAPLYQLGDATGPDGVPAGALAASLGCGNPTAVADLHEGEVVLDLGSGAGLDVLLSARRVGPAGTAYGLDMTGEMLALARANAAAAGVDNAVFLEGYIEDVPLPDASVDVVLSNCVINLSTDKPAVFRELARVVRPGGRVAITDIVADDRLTPAQRAERGSHVGCIAGAMSFGEYRAALEGCGFEEVSLTATHEVADGMSAVIVRARRPVP